MDKSCRSLNTHKTKIRTRFKVHVAHSSLHPTHTVENTYRNFTGILPRPLGHATTSFAKKKTNKSNSSFKFTNH